MSIADRAEIRFVRLSGSHGQPPVRTLVGRVIAGSGVGMMFRYDGAAAVAGAGVAAEVGAGEGGQRQRRHGGVPRRLQGRPEKAGTSARRKLFWPNSGSSEGRVPPPPHLSELFIQQVRCAVLCWRSLGWIQILVGLPHRGYTKSPPSLCDELGRGGPPSCRPVVRRRASLPAGDGQLLFGAGAELPSASFWAPLLRNIGGAGCGRGGS
eukprot:gene9913-biopygen22767